MYTCRTGPDEHFLVYVQELASDKPRFAYVTAYWITDASFKRRVDEEWNRLYPKVKEASQDAKYRQKKR